MTRFTVPDMTCGGCEKAVTAAVRRVDAAAGVSVDLDRKSVDVRSAAAPDAVAAAIRDAGFTVESFS